VKNLDLVVFDCDGVLVDSEVLVMDVEAAMLSEAGFPVSTDDIADNYIGLSYRSMMTDLAARYGRPVPEELSQQIQQAALDRFPDHLRPVAGIDTLLAASDRRRCVASSSDVSRIELSLRITGLAGHFDPGTVFSAQMVERGKPAPDLFLLAASTLGADPGSCLVIEDSTAGVTAAKAAGMEVVGLVAGGHARPHLGQRLLDAGAGRIFERVDQLADYLDAQPAGTPSPM